MNKKMAKNISFIATDTWWRSCAIHTFCRVKASLALPCHKKMSTHT